jgi:hypothetical protein
MAPVLPTVLGSMFHSYKLFTNPDYWFPKINKIPQAFSESEI